MNYPSSPALFDTWANFLLIEVLEDEEPIVWCEDIKQTEIFKEVFINNFDSLWLEEAELKEGRCKFDKKLLEEKVLSKKVFRNYLKTKREPSGQVTYSLAKNDKTYKGMDTEMYDVLQQVLVNEIDMGNSRDFRDAEHLDERFKTLLNCKMHMGTESSWTMLASFLAIPTLHTFQVWPYKSLKRVRFNDVRTYVDPHIEIPDAPGGSIQS